jgi:hypothetical protein
MLQHCRHMPAHLTSGLIGTPVYVQGLTGDKPRILRRQKYRSSGDLVRLRQAAEWDRACHLDELLLAAAMARLGRIRKLGGDRIDPGP